MNEPTFYNSKGELTRYGLACGYIQSMELQNKKLTMWMEHNTIHVRLHNHNTDTRIFWRSFDSVKSARMCYNDAVKELFGEKRNDH